MPLHRLGSQSKTSYVIGMLCGLFGRKSSHLRQLITWLIITLVNAMVLSIISSHAGVSLPDRRPLPSHGIGSCSCSSKFATYQRRGVVEAREKTDRQDIEDMFVRHFNAHPFIPSANGTLMSSAEIYRQAPSELYTWCFSKNFYQLWAYLWTNWYRPDQWKLWARSAYPQEIPVLKTTMIMEFHWRLVKHDYLHRFNRVRIDLVAWILISRVVPEAMRNMHALINRDHRSVKAS